MPLDGLEVADDAAMALDGFETCRDDDADQPAAAIAFPAIDPADMELGDWLAAAREMAVAGAHQRRPHAQRALRGDRPRLRLLARRRGEARRTSTN